MSLSLLTSGNQNALLFENIIQKQQKESNLFRIGSPRLQIFMIVTNSNMIIYTYD